MKKITLCGSTKFKNEFLAVNGKLTLEGNVVYSVAFFGHADKIPVTAEEKETLDRVHKLKIDNSDGIFVIDVGGYIGSSTRSEIEHAEKTGKFVKYLSSFPDLRMICDATLFKKNSNSEVFLKDNEVLTEDLCPDCGGKIIMKLSGIKCSKCTYWYCA